MTAPRRRTRVIRDGLTTDVVNRDDPYQRAKLADNRLKALSELQRVTGEIEQAKKDIADIEILRGLAAEERADGRTRAT